MISIYETDGTTEILVARFYNNENYKTFINSKIESGKSYKIIEEPYNYNMELFLVLTILYYFIYLIYNLFNHK